MFGNFTIFKITCHETYFFSLYVFKQSLDIFTEKGFKQFPDRFTEIRDIHIPFSKSRISVASQWVVSYCSGETIIETFDNTSFEPISTGGQTVVLFPQEVSTYSTITLVVKF